MGACGIKRKGRQRNWPAIIGQRLTNRQLVGLALTVIGACAIGGVDIFEAIGTQTVGHVLFLLGAMLWAL